MRVFKKSVTLIIAACGLFLLILDARGAVDGAREGVQLCICTLIPSLFPFFVISGFFCRVFSETRLTLLNPILHICKIPARSESLFIIGMLGGYPVGAQSIADAYRKGQIDSESAKRMLGFCSNAGPAFVFGIIGAYFDPYIPWVILVILILSAILTGWMLPQTSSGKCDVCRQNKVNFIHIFQNSIRAIASVCGWVILFRVLISYLKRWILWRFPEVVKIALIGFLELSNGCTALDMIINDGARFVVSTGLLSFGGICVYLQTKSISKDLGTGLYFPGKVLQCAWALTISSVAQYFLFPDGCRIDLIVMIVPLLLVLIVYLVLRMQNIKKIVAIPQKLMYNKGKVTANER